MKTDVTVLVSLSLASLASAQLYKASDYFTKISSPKQCYGENLDIYHAFNMTDMGYEEAEKGSLHPGWVICNQSKKETNPELDLDEMYLCNNNVPNDWFRYPSKKTGD